MLPSTASTLLAPLIPYRIRFQNGEISEAAVWAWRIEDVGIGSGFECGAIPSRTRVANLGSCLRSEELSVNYFAWVLSHASHDPV